VVNDTTKLNLLHYAVLCGDGVLYTISPDGGALGVVICQGDHKKYIYTRDLVKLQTFMEYWYLFYRTEAERRGLSLT